MGSRWLCAALLLALAPARAKAASAEESWLAEQEALIRRVEAAASADRAEAEALQLDALRSLARVSGLVLSPANKQHCTRAAQALAYLAIEQLWGTPETTAAQRRVQASSRPSCERALRKR